MEEYNAHLSERLGRGHRPRFKPEAIPTQDTSLQGSPYKIELNRKIRQYVKQQEAINENCESGETWLRQPEFPLSSEINLETGAMVELPANPIHKPYRSTSKYLKIQYKLLREEAVAPLRDAIDRFKQQPAVGEDNVLSVYDKVRVTNVRTSHRGLEIQVRFSLGRIKKRIIWASSRRLISGTLVALTPANDNFDQECVIAAISIRSDSLTELSPPEVCLSLGSVDNILLDPQREYIMVEAKSGYYEAHRHTLRALQKLSTENFPFSDRILGQSMHVDAPSYLQRRPMKVISAAYPEDSLTGKNPINILHEWPSTTQDSTLDLTQWNALEQILTKDVAVVQGPPGTGKTHVSVIALRIMVENRAADDPPIIVAAQTNHALDQLLRHVGDFEPSYIRLGGRSADELVKKRTLREVKKKDRIPNIPQSLFLGAKNELEDLEVELTELLKPFNSNINPFAVNSFVEYGILSKDQGDSLEDAIHNWVSSDFDPICALQHWLGDSLVEFRPVYDEGGFGWEEAEEDLEFEQLNEYEAEFGMTDEDDTATSRDIVRPLFEPWTVIEPSEMDMRNAQELLDTKQDLWDVPEYLRASVYQVMRCKLKVLLLERFRETARRYEKAISKKRIGTWEKDAVYLRHATVVGMTATGLSKYRPLIASLQPKIILIEEAAEVIEAPVAVAAFESLEHMILVGDHLQLRGRCAVSELEGPSFRFDVSMFERLVNLGFPIKTLLKQRRMLPEIRMLISPLYPKLEDHVEVTQRRMPDWGTGQLRSFFFNHEWYESKDSSMSTYNEEEAAMIVGFYRHLLHNGAPPSAITILTFYNGQRKKLLRLIRDDPITSAVAYTRVRTIDSFQGREAKIIILSLARYNSSGAMGFLANANRVCVSLSRAIGGLYIFGNAELVSHNPLWCNVVGQMTIARRLGNKFPLHCARHDKTMYVQYPQEWDSKSPCGGCDQPCGGQMPCGHSCDSNCHPYQHETMLCQKSCGKILNCGRICVQQCHERCQCEPGGCGMCQGASAQGDSSVEITMGTLSLQPSTSSGRASMADGSNMTSPRRNAGSSQRDAGDGRSRYVEVFQSRHT